MKEQSKDDDLKSKPIPKNEPLITRQMCYNLSLNAILSLIVFFSLNLMQKFDLYPIAQSFVYDQAQTQNIELLKLIFTFGMIISTVIKSLRSYFENDHYKSQFISKNKPISLIFLMLQVAPLALYSLQQIYDFGFNLSIFDILECYGALVIFIILRVIVGKLPYYLFTFIKIDQDISGFSNDHETKNVFTLRQSRCIFQRQLTNQI